MRKLSAASVLASFGLFVASQAGAAANSIPYADLAGTDVTFGGSPTFVDPVANPNGWMQETNDDGTSTALYGAPAVSGNSLLFTPANFLAQSTGGGVATTGAQFQVVMTSTNPTTTIDVLNIKEFGDTTLFGAGTAATGTYVAMSGVLTITDDINGPLGSPVQICFPGPCTYAFGVTYTPAQLFSLPTDLGTKSWSAILSIDVASVVPNATRAILSLDNGLIASSEAGTTSKIQKKVVSGPSVVIEVIPEPGTFALVCGGLLALSLRARGRRV